MANLVMGSVVVVLLVVLCWAPFSQAKLNIVSEFMLDYPVVVGSIFSWQDHFYATLTKMLDLMELYCVA